LGLIYTTLVQVDFARWLLVAAVGIVDWRFVVSGCRRPPSSAAWAWRCSSPRPMVMTALNRMPGGGEATALRGGTLIWPAPSTSP
jgi:hypothetical protein